MVAIGVCGCAGAGFSEAQCGDQPDRIGMGQGLEDVPVLLSGRVDDGAQGGEVGGAIFGAEAT